MPKTTPPAPGSDNPPLAAPPTRTETPPKEQSGEAPATSGIANELLQEALKTEIEFSDKPERDKVSDQQVSDIVTDLTRHYNTNRQTAYVGLLATLQAGGTNKNKRSNVKITINKIGFESKKVNEFIFRYCKNHTPRQLARCLANDIFIVSQKFGITGNAYISLKRNYPHLLFETNINERFWASDFQVDNPHCPDYIRTALRQRYIDKFAKKQTK